MNSPPSNDTKGRAISFVLGLVVGHELNVALHLAYLTVIAILTGFLVHKW